MRIISADVVGSKGNPEQEEGRLIVISNRLPVTIKRVTNSKGNQEWVLTSSSGGLVSALGALKRSVEFVWVGWPGFEVEPEHQTELTRKLFEEQACVPVYLEATMADKYYNGFCNGTLWPLFHYQSASAAAYGAGEGRWEAYCQANAAFADAVRSIVSKGDIVWVHDYHLMLVPEMLRLTRSSVQINWSEDVKIGFFLHTPFPSSEVYRVLPLRKHLLSGILASDLVGFHTLDYARHFMTAASRLLRLTRTTHGLLLDDGRIVDVRAFPIGIDPIPFQLAVTSDSVMQRVSSIRASVILKPLSVREKVDPNGVGDGGKKSDWVKILLGVDRLDYIKGVPQKLLAFERLLENNPELVEHVVLVQISVPTRCEVEEYGQLRSFVEAIVGRINGRFGTVCYTPVRYLYRSVPFLELSALYRAADVCIVSSTRDGMNLVACEYIASQTNEAGVLVLSEFAGVAQSLGGAYLVVNPWDQDALAAAMYEAIHMDYESRKNAMQTLSQYVSRHTASYWGRSFIDELTQCRAVGEKKISQYARPLALEEVKSAFKPNSILMIDWDAVVGDYLGGEWRETRPIVNLSSTADFYQSDFLKYDGECHELGPTISDYDDERRIKLAESINRIARSATVWIMTRMPFSCVNQLFTANVSLICEHGCSIRFGTPYFPAKICNEHRKKGIIPKKISDIMGVTTLFDDHGKKLDDHLEAMEKSENVVLARLPGIVRQKLVPIMRYYAQHTPGADFVVATEEILSVSFVGCDSEFADWQARELVSEIDRVLESIGKVVRRGKIANNGLEQSVITEIKTSRNISEVNNNTMLTSESREVLEKYTDYSDQLGFDVKNDKKALKLNTMARIMAEGDFRNVDVIPASGVGKAELLQKIIDTTDGEQFVLVLCDPRTELSAKCKHVDRVNFRFATISNPVSDAPYHVKNVADLLDLLAT